MANQAVPDDGKTYIFRQCITLPNGKRICRPKGQAFRIPVNDNDKK